MMIQLCWMNEEEEWKKKGKSIFTLLYHNTVPINVCDNSKDECMCVCACVFTILKVNKRRGSPKK